MATTDVAAVGRDRSLPTKGVRDTTPALQGLRCDSMAVRAGAHAQGAQLIASKRRRSVDNVWTSTGSTVTLESSRPRYGYRTGGRGTRKLHTPVR